MDLDNGKTYILMNPEGKIISIGEEKLIYKDLSEIKHLNDAFTFWSTDLKELKQYIKASGEFMRGNNPLSELNLEEMIFLEMIEEEDGSVVLC